MEKWRASSILTRDMKAAPIQPDLLRDASRVSELARAEPRYGNGVLGWPLQKSFE
jgi:hypothetical protein